MMLRSLNSVSRGLGTRREAAVCLPSHHSSSRISLSRRQRTGTCMRGSLSHSTSYTSYWNAYAARCRSGRPSDIIWICCSQLPPWHAGVAARVSLRPGETPEQAQERRLRESQKVDERVVHITDMEDWDKATQLAGNDLVVVEVCSSTSSFSCLACYVSDSIQLQSSCTHTMPPHSQRPPPPFTPCRCFSCATFTTARLSLTCNARQASRRKPSCTGSRTSERRCSPAKTSSTLLRALRESAQTCASCQST